MNDGHTEVQTTVYVLEFMNFHYTIGVYVNMYRQVLCNISTVLVTNIE